MARSKWLLLAVLISLFLFACSDTVPSVTPYSTQTTPTPEQSTTAPASTASLTMLASPVQTQPVSTTVFATTASPTTAVTTHIPDTTVSHSNPVFGAVYLAETLDGGLSWSPLITQTNLLKDEYTGFNKLECISLKICAHINSGISNRYSYFDLIKEGSQYLKPVFKLDNSDITCLSQTVCWRITNWSTDEVSGTVDGGVTWQSLTRGKELKMNAANKEIYLKARRNSNINSEIAFIRAISCPNANRCLLAGGGGRSIRTLDGGQTWEWFFTEPVFYFDLVCLSEQTCYAAGRDAFAITNDFGETWQILKKDTGDIKALSCPSLNDCILLAGSSNTILSTHDKGVTWSTYSSSPSVYLFDVSCPTTTNCYVITTANTLLVTQDGGKTWTTRPLELDKFKGVRSNISCPTVTHCYILSKEFY